MGSECGAFWGEEKCIQSFSGEACRNETTWNTWAYEEEDSIKMDVRKRVECMDWGCVVQDRNE